MGINYLRCEPATSNKQPATSNQQPATSNQQPAMHKLLLFSILFIHQDSIAQSLQKYEPVSFSQVTINDNFWKPKLDKVATKTLAACIYQTEIKTPRIRNFEKIARNKGEKFEGIYYDDSDVYKALEAIGYSLKNKWDTALEAT